MGVTQVKEGINRFKSGCMSVESSGRPQTSRNAAVVERVKHLVMKVCRLTLLETAEQVYTSTGSTQAILCDHAQSGCEICSQTSVGRTEGLPS
ncbi:hypothetical protein TNCV_404581 [Trichonephila clavipes]|nr:hypothetical protein TNCV_404581 [Trichonephila clavipes]